MRLFRCEVCGKISTEQEICCGQVMKELSGFGCIGCKGCGS